MGNLLAASVYFISVCDGGVCGEKCPRQGSALTVWPLLPLTLLLFVDGSSCHTLAITKAGPSLCLPLHRNQWAILH